MDYQRNANKRKRSPSPSPAGKTSSASTSASGGEYEVFLSFCGVDTRHRFTDFLYTCLIDAGIHTFRDNEELHVGEKIGPVLLKAIEESKISIPVFSKNYASSKWCLRELAQMVKCHTDLEQKIFPIFYDVEPSDVRHQTGSYEQAFRNHERRFDGTIVQRWKEALTTVGKLKGLELEKETNGHEGELAKKVTMKVLIELKKNYMDITEHLVGIEDQVKEMEELLNAKSDAVQIVGILGMGGIGKTTLAKVIYNKISEHFESFSFLENVRERIQQHEGLVGLQNELCRNRMALDNIANVDERRNMIKNTVFRKKFFIVLDDVDEKSQFDKLVKPEWFDKKSRGSEIIVTTRNKEVLTLIAADSTYEPPTMEFKHSLKLFSKHAFRKDSPPEEYDSLSRKFVDTAAGLPLALELTGSHLYAQNKSNWPGILEKLEKIPRQDVQKKLEISYEALDDLQKQIFLDIACFLIGEEKRVAFYMWKDCKFYPEDGIEVLVLRSLIKISDDNRLWMHDQLRDMGRNIVYKENRAKPWERSRVWSCDDAWETMERCKETQEHEAVKVETFKVKADSVESYPPFPKEFGQLKRLRYLEVEYGQFTKYFLHKRVIDGDAYVGDFKHSFPKLRWLKWHELLLRYRVTNFHLEKLIILDLSWSSFRDNSDSWNQIKMAKNLKVLNLACCSGFDQVPDFSTFTALEMLNLRSCRHLVKLDPSIGNLTSLRVLDISSCYSITELPDAIGNLEKLEEINAAKCFSLRGQFPDIRRLSSLRILNLRETKIDRLPESICELSRLETLDLSFGVLQSLPELPSSLTSLAVACESMKAFPSLSKLKSLDVFSCNNLAEIPIDIDKLSELESLRLIDTSISTLPAEIGDLPRLKTLSIRSHKLQSIQGLPSSLIDLSISSSRSMERLPNLSNLKNLSTLLVRRCSKLMHIECLGKIESLTSLAVYKCKRLAEVDGLENYESLRYLTTKGCKSLCRLSNLSNLGMLKILDLSNCLKLAKVEGLSFLKSLEVLKMSFCTSLEGVLDLSNLGMLKNLGLSNCWKLTKVEGLSFLKSLEELNMSFCTSLDILDLSNLGMLKNLDLSDCRKLAKVEGLSFLKSLKELDMSFCTSLEGILDLSNLGMIKYLYLSHCRKSAKVEGLSFLKSLEALDMSYYTSLEGILDLSNLKKLRYLRLCGWNNLNVIGEFEELESLETLCISDCKIEKSPDFSNLKKLRWLDISGSSMSIENPLDLPNTRIVTDSHRPFPSEAFENEEEDSSNGGSDGLGYSDSGLDSDLEYEGFH